MDELESQVAKIQIGNPKTANAYVLVAAEKAASSSAELFVVAELPLLNPAALDSCEKICLAIVGALRRAYKKPLTANTFENAIAQINDELGKLASLGQTHWIDKLNCIVAVKEGSTFHITTCGKVASFLYRDGQFTDISSSPEHSHPLKTFENLATGRIRLGDLVLLSTTQLFNYLAMDRFKDILGKNNFLGASQTILEILKENSGPEIAFGTILNLQVMPGETVSDEIDLEEYTAGTSSPVTELFGKVGAFFSSMLLKSKSRKPSVELPKIASPAETNPTQGTNTSRFGSRNFSGAFSLKNFKSRAVKSLDTAVAWVTWVFRKLNLHNFRNFSTEKKFFLFSVLILLVSVVATLGVAKKVNQNKKNEQVVLSAMSEVSTLLDKASNSLLYHNENDAKNFLSQATAKLPAFADVPKNSQDRYHNLEKSLSELKLKLDKNTDAQVTSLGNLGSADFLIKLPKHVAIQVNGNIVSYDKTSSLFQDGTLKVPEIILRSVTTTGNQAVIYTGSSLMVWDYEKGTVGTAHSLNVPVKENYAGLAWYPTSSRVYMVDKKANRIYSYLANGGTVSKPVVWSKDANDLGSTVDIAIDGSIYVLNANGITRYFGGSLAEFNFPQLSTKFSGQGKIFTDKDTKNIYVLDAGNNRILIMDKKGSLITTLTSKQFTNLRDFQVDEKSKTMWALNGTTLLKVTIP